MPPCALARFGLRAELQRTGVCCTAAKKLSHFYIMFINFLHTILYDK